MGRVFELLNAGGWDCVVVMCESANGMPDKAELGLIGADTTVCVFDFIRVPIVAVDHTNASNGMTFWIMSLIENAKGPGGAALEFTLCLAEYHAFCL